MTLSWRSSTSTAQYSTLTIVKSDIKLYGSAENYYMVDLPLRGFHAELFVKDQACMFRAENCYIR